jgi:hypothetical protein
VKAQDLVGTWRLRSWKNVGIDGSAVAPLGENPLGFIMYSSDGYVSVAAMAAQRAPHGAPGALGGSSEASRASVSDYISYSGRYEVRAEDDVVIHHIEVCLYPNGIGTSQMRFVKLDGNVLTLTTEPMIVQGVDRSTIVVWDRVGEHMTDPASTEAA